jgi:hypothetical protein
MVIGHEADPVHDASVARALAEALPNAELVLYPSYYALLRETPAIIQRVGAFLSE